jgi:hypothetical protein
MISKVPEPIVKKLLSQFFNFDGNEVDMIFNQIRNDNQVNQELGISPQGAVIGDPFLQGKVAVDGMLQQQDMMAQQQDMMAQQQGLPPEQDGQQEQPVQDMNQVPEQDDTVPEYSQDNQEVDPNENLQPNQTNQVSNQGVSVAEAFRIDEQVKRVLKDKTLTESFEEAIDIYKLNKNMYESEYKFNQRHYLSNSFVSEDQNVTGYISVKDPNQKKQIMENISIQKAPKEKKVKGMMEVSEDSIIDRRFLTKEEKKVL